MSSAPTQNISPFDATGIKYALAEAQKGYDEGGVPIGAALITEDGKVLGTGRNRRVQQNSAIHHGETDCLERIGRLPASVYKNCTMFTTLSPCIMCTGACLLYGIKRVVMGENTNYVGGEELLRSRGVEVVNLNSVECKEIMSQFIQEHPDVWYEDIGENIATK